MRLPVSKILWYKWSTLLGQVEEHSWLLLTLRLASPSSVFFGQLGPVLNESVSYYFLLLWAQFVTARLRQVYRFWWFETETETRWTWRKKRGFPSLLMLTHRSAIRHFFETYMAWYLSFLHSLNKICVVDRIKSSMIESILLSCLASLTSYMFLKSALHLIVCMQYVQGHWQFVSLSFYLSGTPAFRTNLFWVLQSNASKQHSWVL